MEQSTTRGIIPGEETTINSDPNIFIIWLDKHIGKPDECILLKRSFFMTMDPRTGLYERSLQKDDIDNSIQYDVRLLIQLDEVEFLFQAFEDVEKCFLTIEKNRSKRIFFITSGSKGRIIIPSLIANFPETFVHEYWMYIFCANMNMVSAPHLAAPTNTWALNFIERVLMFDHQDDVLARMILDIASYFFTEAQSFDRSNELDNAIRYCEWSKKLYKRFETLEQRSKTKEISEIDQHIKNIEERRNIPENNEEDAVAESTS